MGIFLKTIILRTYIKDKFTVKVGLIYLPSRQEVVDGRRSTSGLSVYRSSIYLKKDINRLILLVLFPRLKPKWKFHLNLTTYKVNP